jgi:hypothetical protein
MDGVLEKSRIAVSLVPERLIAEAAFDDGVLLDELTLRRDGDVLAFEEVEQVRKVLGSALAKWWQIIPIWVRLSFTMQHQQQTQWCWSAVSVSVAHYYVPSSTWTQCEMANQEMGQTTCCVDGSTTQCNQPNVLDAPLNRAGVLDHVEFGTVGFDAIRQEIDGSRPLAWRIGWSGGGGHFAVIEGYRVLGQNWVAVDDPWYGESDVALSTLTGGGYQGSGSWTHTYFTRRPALIFPGPWLEDRFRFPWEIWERVRVEQRSVLAGGAGAPAAAVSAGGEGR